MKEFLDMTLGNWPWGEDEKEDGWIERMLSLLYKLQHRS